MARQRSHFETRQVLAFEESDLVCRRVCEGVSHYLHELSFPRTFRFRFRLSSHPYTPMGVKSENLADQTQLTLSLSDWNVPLGMISWLLSAEIAATNGGTLVDGEDMVEMGVSGSQAKPTLTLGGPP